MIVVKAFSLVSTGWTTLTAILPTKAASAATLNFAVSDHSAASDGASGNLSLPSATLTVCSPAVKAMPFSRNQSPSRMTRRLVYSPVKPGAVLRTSPETRFASMKPRSRAPPLTEPSISSQNLVTARSAGTRNETSASLAFEAADPVTSSGTSRVTEYRRVNSSFTCWSTVW